VSTIGRTTHRTAHLGSESSLSGADSLTAEATTPKPARRPGRGRTCRGRAGGRGRPGEADRRTEQHLDQELGRSRVFGSEPTQSHREPQNARRASGASESTMRLTGCRTAHHGSESSPSGAESLTSVASPRRPGPRSSTSTGSRPIGSRPGTQSEPSSETYR